jgi:hypothetical protein
MNPNPQHLALMTAFKQPIGIEGKDMPAPEILAIACQLVGNLIAVQDQRIYSSEKVMELVSRNIQIGNQVAIEELLKTEGSA